jgi:hypothetical protein
MWRSQKKNLVALFSSVVKLLVVFFGLIFMMITSYVGFEVAIVKNILQNVVYGRFFFVEQYKVFSTKV